MNKLYGLVGEKLGHSISPQIHNLIFKELNQQATYDLFQVKKERLREVVQGLKYLGFSGVNVTIPYKIDVMSQLDNISEEARRIGAINTICFSNEIATGHNTDYYGFGMLLNKFQLDIKHKEIVVLGTGGSSKAVIQYIKDNGAAKITLVTRTLSKENLNENYEIIDYDKLNKISKGDIIINTTPVGMFPNIDVSPVGESILSKFEAAVDLIYNPSETLFLKTARECGAKSANGLYMLVGQAVTAEELWNNVLIKKEVVDKIFDQLRASLYE
jgi:shikimate dehydrogenase